jgi:serine/threonine protein kinase
VRYLGLFSPNEGKDMYIVMEFLGKGSLDRLLHMKKFKIPESDLVAMFESMGE